MPAGHSNFEELLYTPVSRQYKNIHALATELYKIATDMSPKIMSEVFKIRDTPCYNLQHTSQFSIDPIHSVYNGTESDQHCIWDQRFRSKYLHKLKIRNLLMSLKEKSNNGNPLNVHVEFT